MRLALAFVVIMVAARTATAGICLDEEEDREAMATLEKYAAGKISADKAEYAVLCARALESLAPRLEKACTTILDKHPPPASGNGVAWECAAAMAARGHTRAGDFDLLALYLAADHGPRGDGARGNAASLASIDDPAAREEIVKTYREALEAIADKPLRGSRARSWLKWQIGVLDGLARHATATERDFLQSLADTAPEKRVRRDAKRAVELLDARIAAP
jgi:hypothetical protein